MSKVVKSIRAAIEAVGLKDGMCVSFHHHLRNGDYVINEVIREIAAAGIRGLTVNASSLADCHASLAEYMKDGTIVGLETDYVGPKLGKQLSGGILETPVIFRTHGGRPAAMAEGTTKVDVAFLAASACDTMGNCTGLIGKSAFGSMGYAYPDAAFAGKVVVITDTLVEYPLARRSIDEAQVDYVVVVDEIGDPSGIVSGTTKLPSDPVTLIIAGLAAKAIAASGALRDGFSFQTGAGGASLATAAALHRTMKEQGVRGSYALGGITQFLVDMLDDGCFQALQDVQCFDLGAVVSLRDDPRHIEISAQTYASPSAKSSAASGLDVAVLGAAEIDVDFNVNIHTDSNGLIIGGSGGHSDVAEEAKLTIITAPLYRKRLTTIRDKVICVSTPGKDVDLLVTQAGLAVNPRRPELEKRLRAAGLPVFEIRELKEKSESFNGIAQDPRFTQRVVAEVYSRRGELLDRIFQVDY